MHKLTEAERMFIEQRIASERQVMAQVDRAVLRRHSQAVRVSPSDERPELDHTPLAAVR